LKILLCSVPFSPSVGGIERVSALLAERFVHGGHEVTVVTQSAGPAVPATYKVVRRPSLRRLLSLVVDCDVVLHNQISLRLAWPLLLVRRPWVVAHHSWIDIHGASRLAVAVKRGVLGRARHIAVSRAIADSLPVPSRIVPNPYADAVFTPQPDVPRERELLFVGRLVSDKGVDLLLEALSQLRQHGQTPGLSIVGDGPEAAALQAQARHLGLADQVQFSGPLHGTALARALSSHRFLVMPSVWAEPFGLVALEALACGCLPLVARTGGLPEAIGPCGLSFAPGNVADLALCLQAALADPAERERQLAKAPSHLARHRAARVAQDYLEVLADARRSDRPAPRVAGA